MDEVWIVVCMMQNTIYMIDQTQLSNICLSQIALAAPEQVLNDPAREKHASIAL